MHQSAQQITDRKLYLIYKGIVVTYIQSFAQQLVQYSHAIRALLLTWTGPDGKKARLLECLHLLDTWLQEDRRSLTPERCQEITEEWHRAFTI